MGGVFGKNPSRPCCIFQASKRLSVFLTVKVVVIIMESNIVGKLELPPFSKELKKAPVIGSHGEKSTTFILIFFVLRTKVPPAHSQVLSFQTLWLLQLWSGIGKMVCYVKIISQSEM